MWDDLIVEEVRKVRDEYAASHGYDVHRIFEDLRRRARERGDNTISLPPKRAKRVAKAK